MHDSGLCRFIRIVYRFLQYSIRRIGHEFDEGEGSEGFGTSDCNPIIPDLLSSTAIQHWEEEGMSTMKMLVSVVASASVGFLVAVIVIPKAHVPVGDETAVETVSSSIHHCKVDNFLGTNVIVVLDDRIVVVVGIPDVQSLAIGDRLGIDCYRDGVFSTGRYGETRVPKWVCVKVISKDN